MYARPYTRVNKPSLTKSKPCANEIKSNVYTSNPDGGTKVIGDFIFLIQVLYCKHVGVNNKKAVTHTDLSGIQSRYLTTTNLFSTNMFTLGYCQPKSCFSGELKTGRFEYLRTKKFYSVPKNTQVEHIYLM